MITVTNLNKIYNSTRALEIGLLEIPRGQNFGLVGNNGAGKTTFFSLLLDLIQPSTGNVFNNGITVNQSEAWKSFTSSYIDESFLIGYLTPEEYFNFIGELRNQNKADVASFLKDFTDFFSGEVLDQRKYLRDLSKGNQKKVGLVAAFLGDPEVIVLDEPFAHLDPTAQIRLKRILKDLNRDHGITLLISSHDLTHVTEVCERIVVLDTGEVVKDIKTSKTTLGELEKFFASDHQVERKGEDIL